MQKFADVIQKAVFSRTVWTIIAMFLFNGLNAIHSSVSPTWGIIINVVLGLLATFFKLSPSQKY